MRPRPPFEVHYPPSTDEPPGVTTTNTLPVNRGQQPSRGNLLAAPPHCPWNHTYLLLVQSHPHSTVLSPLTAKPPNSACRCRPTKTKSRSAIDYFPHCLFLIPIHRRMQTLPP